MAYASLHLAFADFDTIPYTVSTRKAHLKNKEGYHYLDLDKARVTTLRKPSRSASKAVITPFGKFDSMVDAAKFEGVRVQTLREWVKNSNRSDYEFF